ncbi:MAG: hypothetical protein GWP41_04075 [Planctomycetia bacterium]|nr:hypothetical protein [Planctomycetia bacterium]
MTKRTAVRSKLKSSSSTRKRNTYSDAFRRKVVTFSVKNGIVAAAQKFDVSPPSVTNWRKDFGVTRATKEAATQGKKLNIPQHPNKNHAPSGRKNYSDSFREEVANFSALEGVEKTAIRFGVSAPSVTNWRREFGVNRQMRAELLEERKKLGLEGGGAPSKKEIQRIRNQVKRTLELLDTLLEEQ